MRCFAALRQCELQTRDIIAAAKLQIRQNKGGENPTPPKNSREIEGGVGMIVALSQNGH